MQWWGINLASHPQSDGGFAEIAEAFSRAFAHAGQPSDAAVFAGGLSSIGQTLYFSPQAYAIAPDLVARFDGVPVPRPDRARLLIGGDGAARLGVEAPFEPAHPPQLARPLKPAQRSELARRPELGQPARFAPRRTSAPRRKPTQPLRCGVPRDPRMSHSPGKPCVRVACALIERDGKLLVARRAAGKVRAGKWELPGGKVNAGETAANALVREIAEELGCVVRVLDAMAAAVHAYPDVTVELIAIRCELVDGEPRALEHAEIRWADAAELAALDWSDADVSIVRGFVAARARG